MTEKKAVLHPEYLFKDYAYGNRNARPANRPEILDGKHGSLFTTCFQAGGEGIRPTVLFCHGYPGNEENMDIAHALRRIGFDVMTFHYSGSWGSGGVFSFQNCIDDTLTMVDYILEQGRCGGDPANLYLFGQSMGGFVISHVAAARDDLGGAVLAMPADFGKLGQDAIASEEGKALLEICLQDGIGWLNGATMEGLEKECHAFARGRSFSDLAALQKMPMLILSAEYDTLVPPDTAIEPWIRKLQSIPDSRVQYKRLPTDHMFTDYRCHVAELTAGYLTQLWNG